MTPLTDGFAALGVVVPSRCSSKLKGTGCVRSCARCGLTAYDVRLRTAAEVRGQIELSERRSVYRFYERKDGLLFSDACPKRFHWPSWVLTTILAVIIAAVGIIVFYDDTADMVRQHIGDEMPLYDDPGPLHRSFRATFLTDARAVQEQLSVAWTCVGPEEDDRVKYDRACEDLMNARIRILLSKPGQVIYPTDCASYAEHCGPKRPECQDGSCVVGCPPRKD